MNLQGRNLSIEMHGADISLLHAELLQLRYHIADEETATQRFGETTYEAVVAFQRTYGLEITGVVDNRTVKLMNAVVEALHSRPDRFVVKGQIRLQDDGPLPSAIVRAFDKDMRSGEPLGENITDERGHYEITYTADKFSLAEKSSADLIIRVFDSEGVQLAESEILFNGPPEATIDLVVVPNASPPLSEYDQLWAEISPLLENVPIAELTDQDITFLVREAGVDKQHLEIFIQSAKLSADTDLLADVFYALLRQDFGPTLDRILAQPEDRVRKALAEAQEAGFIATLDTVTIDKVMLKFQRLRHQQTPLVELAQSMGLNPSSPIFGKLAEKDIKTLEDVRNTGGLHFAEDLDISPDDPAVQKLDAHARLMTLNSDISINETLIAKGYYSLTAIAQATTEEIATALGDAPRSGRAAVLHANAKAQSAFVQNVAMGFAGNRATGIDTVDNWRADHPIQQVLPGSCGCKDCDAAVSPRAYLADLMQYAIDHLRNNGAKIDLAFFKTHFHQPFSELPANCSAQDEEVCQVRICIEVLRSYLGQRPLTPPSIEIAVKQAEQRYLLDTYQRLLTKLGTNFTEIRLARGAALEVRKQIAERIGIAVGALSSLFLDPSANPAQLTEAALERLFGLADTTQPPIRQKPVPAMQTWRLLNLRTVWKSQDWPSDDYSDNKLPIIDPDLLGPDDFRYPTVKTNGQDKVFDIWVARRTWADGLIKTLKNVAPRQDTATNTSGPDFQAIVNAMGFSYRGQAPRWPADALADIRTRLAALTGENNPATAQELYNNYRLSLDAARRLTALWEKDNVFWAWKDPKRVPKLTDDEWEEVYSIILRAQKNELSRFWMQEEKESVLMRVQAGELRKVWAQDDDASQVLFGQREFWTPSRKPLEGDWPPNRISGIPLIDPEKIKRQDLPDQIAGRRALEFWDDRAVVLDTHRKLLKTTLETSSSSFSDMVTEALGSVPASAASWEDYFRQLASDLSSTDPATASAAKTTIEGELHLTLEGLQRIVSVMEIYLSSVAKALPSKADWADVFSLLTSAWKLTTLYAGWYVDEIDAANGVEPWRCVRQSLHKWRTTVDERQRWERALEVRSRAPLVDPDVLASTGYFKTPGFGDAWSLWDQRRQAIDVKFQSVKVQGLGTNRTATTLDSITDVELGQGVLQELVETKEAGKAIAARLQQINLSFVTLNELLRVRELLRATPPEQILDSEWDSVCSILTQVWKQRQFADWQVEERTKGVLLSADSFRLLPVDVTQFPPPPPPKLDPWRGSADALLDWQDTLQSRIDQEQETITGLINAVSDVEEQTLPTLRDALVVAAYPPGLSTTPAGRWLGDHLAIATEYDGCNRTTRISQAIETFQIILWSVRTGTLLDVYPNLKLIASDFDEEWKWIGSYATWRAAMFVFLYPENILLPTLRRVQTRAFRELVNEMRGIRKLTPIKAREVAERYASYFRDVCTIGDLKASTEALTTTNSGDRDLWYLFATGGETQQLYWAVYDPIDPTGFRLGFWDVVPGLAGKTATVVGTDMYQVIGHKRYLYLFVKVESDGKEELAFNRYDLRNRAWQPELSMLKLPDKVTNFSATLRERLSATSATELPRIAIQGPNGVFYERFLDKPGLDWEEGDWIPRAQLWKKWASADPTTLNAGRLVPGGRLFATHFLTDSVFVSALGQDRQVYGFYWSGKFISTPWDLQNIVPMPKFTGGLLPGTGGITGVFRNAPLPNSQTVRDQIDLFTVGNNRYIYTAKWDWNNGWQPWTRVAAPGNARENSIVAAIARHPEHIDIFVIGTDARLYTAAWGRDTTPQYTWTPFVELLSIFLASFPISGSAVTAVRVSPYRLDLFLHYWLFQDVLVNITWTDKSGWPSVSSTALGDPTVPDSRDMSVEVEAASAVRTRNLFDLFIPRKSGEIWTVRRDVNGDWEKWEVIGERSAQFSGTTVVSTVVRSAGEVLLFATDNKGIVQSNWQRDAIDEGKWHAWAPVEAPFTPTLPPNGYVAAVRSPNWPTVRIFTIGNDGNIYWTESLEELPQRKVTFIPSSYKPALPLNTSVSKMVITEQHTEMQRADRPSWVASVFTENSSKTETIQEYLKEFFYFIPVHIAMQLQKSGAYIAALDWFRLVYDYTMPFGSRQLVGLPPELTATTANYQRTIGTWLLDPLNPHSIAETRANAYTRYTLQSIINCMLDYADSEFTRDTAESVPRARELYETVLELLDAPELPQKKGECDQIIGDLSIVVNDPHYKWIEVEIKQILEGISDVLVLKEVVAKLVPILAGAEPPHQKYAAMHPILADLTTASVEVIPVGRLVEGDDSRLPLMESAILSNTEVTRAMEVTLATHSYTRPADTSITLAGALAQPLDVLIDVVALPSSMGVWEAMSVFSFCVPPNPVLRSLHMRADLNLYKIRNCRNIAGMERQLEPFAAATDTSSGMPVIGGGGQLVLPGVGQLQATPYRYSVLIDRAKQLVQQAVQVESAFLAALEKSDREAYDLLNARANIRLAQAGVRLQDIRVVEAEDGVKLAELQRDRSNIQANTYDAWLGTGLTDKERLILQMYDYLAVAQSLSVAFVGAMQAITGGLQIGAIYALQAAYQGANIGKAVADVMAIEFQRNINSLSFQVSHELRMQEWSLQKSLADQDVRIGEQQIDIANDHVRIVDQERVIEQMKADHSKEVLDFLTNKFTNKDLYDWMSGVLERVYSFFLQQATSMAQLAADQLAFERQETPPVYIQDDYWEMPSDDSGTSGPGAKTPDRRGLTGSARLLQDIYQLDQYAFEKNQRKQQLTKIISLAQLDPFAFQQFRETGVLPFATPMELFDRDFPGHYLRLIKRIRTTVIALIPPSQGTRATLTSLGISRVVIGGDMFQTAIVRRPPETVALSAPFNATGLFELQEQPEMLLPFEDLGVATSWEFAMPKAANQFDYSTIADVHITIEYTALNSFDYRQQVVQLLNAKRTTSADRAFSFRNQFADAWYDLHNPELLDEARQMVVHFSTVEQDFPPNLESLKIQHIVLYFARKNGSTFEIPVNALCFTEQGSARPVGGPATSVDGVINTRSGNVGSWTEINGRPFGKWELALPNTEEMKNHFKNEEIQDILFVITYSGRAPEWPI